MGAIDAKIMKLGQEGYMLCQACHGPDGNGMPNLAPPLAGSEWVLGPIDNLVRMQFRGLQGPITVKGEEWNGVMAPMGPALGSDENLAAVLTFIRNSWGNEASAVAVADVSKHRDEIGKPMLTVADLIDPKQAAPAPKASTLPVKEVVQTTIVIEPNKSGNLAIEEAPSSGILGGLGVGFWLVVCLIPVLGGLIKYKK